MTFLFINILVIGSIVVGYAQPKIPKENVPSNIAADVKEQIERLYSHNPVERAKAAIELGGMGERAAPAIPFLIGILGDHTSLQWFPQFLFTSPSEQAAKALAKIGKPAAEVLIEMLQDRGEEKKYLRLTFIGILGGMKDPRSREQLIVLLKDDDLDIRIAAAEALFTMKDPLGLEHLISNLTVALKAKFFHDRRKAASRLGWLGDKRAVEPLIAALKDQDSSVRQAVASALGYIKDKRAIEPLIAILNDDAVSHVAAQSLAMITSKNFGKNSIDWQEWWEKNKPK